jgi:cytochrome c553
MEKRSLLNFLFCVCLFSANVGNALTIKEAEEKANQVCAACHGKDGVNGVLPSYPIIAGQYSDYLNQALTDYKSGARKNAVMGGIAATLTKEEISGLSRYFASLPTPLNDKNRKD